MTRGACDGRRRHNASVSNSGRSVRILKLQKSTRTPSANAQTLQGSKGIFFFLNIPSPPDFYPFPQHAFLPLFFLAEVTNRFYPPRVCPAREGGLFSAAGKFNPEDLTGLNPGNFFRPPPIERQRQDFGAAVD